MSTGRLAGLSLDGIECMRGCAVTLLVSRSLGGGLNVGTSVMMWEGREELESRFHVDDCLSLRVVPWP